MKQHEHRIRTDDDVELALHRIEVPGAPRVEAPPVLLVSGTFNGRHFWLGEESGGVARQLAESGLDTWIMEPRGHGASQRPPRWLLSEWIERDAPAAVAAVSAATGGEGVTWVGHSAGGVVGAAFSGLDLTAARLLRGLVLIGTPGPGALRGRRRWLARGFHWAAAARGGGFLPGEALKLGPERESAPLVRQWLGWNLRGEWSGSDGTDYLAQLYRVTAPVLAVAGSDDDLLAPLGAVRDLLDRFHAAERELLVAGRAHGLNRDYNHGGMVLARSAREEIWPRIVRWLARRGASGQPPLDPVQRP